MEKMIIDGYKLKELGVFMTQEDEFDISDLLKEKFKNISFIAVNPCENKMTINESIITRTAILNRDITSLDEYFSWTKQINKFYHFAQAGKGIVLCQPSKRATYNNNCLKDGYFTASYKIEDMKTDSFVKEIFKLIKTKSKKVYRISPNRNIRADIEEKNFFALPNAVNQFNGEDNNYLTIGNEIFLIAD
jgi:hypothetical protein